MSTHHTGTVCDPPAKIHCYAARHAPTHRCTVHAARLSMGGAPIGAGGHDPHF